MFWDVGSQWGWEDHLHQHDDWLSDPFWWHCCHWRTGHQEGHGCYLFSHGGLPPAWVSFLPTLPPPSIVFSSLLTSFHLISPFHFSLLWEQLTGREHLLFYGRLKNLKGQELTQAVDDSLRSVNLFNVGNKRAGQYSGGMKRRLSVAISLIGNPLVCCFFHSLNSCLLVSNTAIKFLLHCLQVVYMDEPSTGLDPASRLNLWNVVKDAKKDKAIILTSKTTFYL